VPSCAARPFLTTARLLRVIACVSLAACALLFAGQGLQNAAANGDTRTISFRHTHTGERLTVTYKREGRWDDGALKQINHVMRDWRRNEEVRIDPRVIDIIWEVNRDVGGREAIEIICGFRAPATNQMLRRRSRGVAQFSQHTLGKAVDFNIPGASLEAVRIAGLRLQRGGVGFYPSSNFVHLDVGSVRHWPRMTYDQLARVFPNGRTVHVPSNGRPLPGYALAMADVQKRGGAPSQLSLDAAQEAGVATTEKPKKTLLASLFSTPEPEEDDDNQTTAASASPATPAQAPSVRTTKAAVVPLPVARPTVRLARNAPAADKAKPVQEAGAFSLASADSRPIDLSAPLNTEEATPADVFTARGLWEGPQGRPEPPGAIPEPTATEVASADPSQPPSLGPARRADQDMTGAINALRDTQPGTDRVPADVALAYAAHNDGVTAPPSTPRAAPMGTNLARAGAPAKPPAQPLDTEGLTTIIKKTVARATAPRAAQAAPSPITAAEPRRIAVAVAGDTFSDPWMRAMLLAPDLQNYLTVTEFEAPDLRGLRALMIKPGAVALMTFSRDPHLGMVSDRFTGSAVVFMSTVTFAGRTAMLP
jgi:uncharacterized protein YcbK (DUF882 family)